MARHLTFAAFSLEKGLNGLCWRCSQVLPSQSSLQAQIGGNSGSLGQVKQDPRSCQRSGHRETSMRAVMLSTLLHVSGAWPVVSAHHDGNLRRRVGGAVRKYGDAGLGEENTDAFRQLWACRGVSACHDWPITPSTYLRSLPPLKLLGRVRAIIPKAAPL